MNAFIYKKEEKKNNTKSCNFVLVHFHAGLASSTTEFTITGKFPAAHYAYFTCVVLMSINMCCGKFIVLIHLFYVALVQNFVRTFDVENFSFNFDSL